MASVRPRRHAAVLCSAPARGWNGQVRPQQAHRPGHRLAVPERAEEGDEGMNRREFLRGATLAGTGGLMGVRPSRVAAEPPPETTKLRLIKTTSLCWAPQYVAEDLLKAEGFTDVSYVDMPVGQPVSRVLTGGGADIGCPPRTQELRARKIGRVIVNSAADRPWSQYFCCLVTGSREFVAKSPVATKRAIRAILKAADLCATEPDRVARTLVDRKFTPRYDYAVQMLKELPYGKWREYDPEDTIRFYALRLHEAGLLKSNPQKLIAQASDWRILNELKKELKG